MRDTKIPLEILAEECRTPKEEKYVGVPIGDGSPDLLSSPDSHHWIREMTANYSSWSFVKVSCQVNFAGSFLTKSAANTEFIRVIPSHILLLLCRDRTFVLSIHDS